MHIHIHIHIHRCSSFQKSLLELSLPESCCMLVEESCCMLVEEVVVLLCWLLCRGVLRPTAVKFDSTTAAPIMSWVGGHNLLFCCGSSLYLLIVVAATIMSMPSVSGKSALPNDFSSSSEKIIGSFCEEPFPSAGGVTKEDSTKSGRLIFLVQGLARMLMLGLPLAAVVIVLLVLAGEETERREEIELLAGFFRNNSSREKTRSSVSSQKKYSSPES
jgi:hypothetical protein